MYPEFLCMDLTFCTNAQNRSLFLMAGINGSKDIVTFGRCFMPSKRAKAFRWLIKKALPTIFGEDTLRRVSCVCSDQEEGLIHCLRSSMKKGSLMPYAKHRLDKYHLFVIPWKNNVRKETSVTTVIRQWIDSWFHKIEKREEFTHSLNSLYNFLSTNKANICDGDYRAIDGIVGNISDLE